MIPCTRCTLPLACLALISLTVGCYHPYPNQQPYGYTQPGYAPPQSFSPQQVPGQLVIPQSNAPLYEPGDNNSSSPRTFEGDDTWERSRDSDSGGQFYGDEPDGLVPKPRDRSEFDSDFPNTRVEPSVDSSAVLTAARHAGTTGIAYYT